MDLLHRARNEGYEQCRPIITIHGGRIRVEGALAMKSLDFLYASVLLVLSIIQISCKELGGGIAGPCVHIYEEPILHIEWARNAQSGTYLQTVILSDIRIDTAKADLRFLISGSKGVAMLDSSLVCNPPAAFGTQAARYSFRVSASGYRDTVVICYPDYSVFKGGCPSSSNGGLRINITLQPN